jgi:uncharacterized protein
MIFELSAEEAEFIVNNECCRLATCFKNKPHVVPVCYIFRDGYFYISTDYGTKKFYNIKNNPYASLVVDVYSPLNHEGVVICGSAILVERGELFKEVYTMFYNKFDWVKNNPWLEGESPFIKIQPESKTSWGLNKK